MSAQIRNDSRYERQAHAHVLQAHDLTTSTHWIQYALDPPPPHGMLRWNRDCLGLQSSKTVPIPPQLRWDPAVWRCCHAPESVSRFEASEWDEISAESLNRKAFPGLTPYSGMHFPPRASNGNCSPQFGRKVGCSFLGLGKERRLRRVASPTPPAGPSRA